MHYITRLQCTVCEKEYDPKDVEYTCPACGNNGNLTVLYDYHLVKKGWHKEDLLTNRDFTIWRYLPLLPIQNPSHIPPVQVGWTPLYQFPKLAKEYGCADLIIKDDGRNPTASFKDRPSVIAVAKALEKKAQVITCASTGNAASSLAGACASVGLPSVIFVPQTAPQAKITQLLVYGAKVVMVKGTYDQAFDLSLKATEKFGWYSRNTGFNPYTREGKKTVAFELCEQLMWQVPDKIIISVGDGNIISGAWKGFLELKEIGWIDHLPHMYAVQAEGASPVVKAIQSGNPIVEENAQTVADSISVGNPRDGLNAVKAVTNSGGKGITVTDKEILDAIPALAQKTGIFAEPAASAAYAGFLKLAQAGEFKTDDKAAVLITGNGLKDISGAMKSVSTKPILIEADERELDKISISYH